MEIGELFFGEKHGKIAHGLNFAPKIIPWLDVLVSTIEGWVFLDTNLVVVGILPCIDWLI